VLLVGLVSTDDDRFTSFHPNGNYDIFCGRPSLHFRVPDGVSGSTPQFVETIPTALGADSVIQFDITTRCDASAPATSLKLEVQFADTGSTVWQPVATTMCTISSSACQTWFRAGGGVINSLDMPNGWQRMTLRLPSVKNDRRYRVARTGGTGGDWAISNLFIGSSCGQGCNGRGSCGNDGCTCDAGSKLVGDSSCVPDGPFLKQLSDDFNSASINETLWSSVVGGSLTSGDKGCGVLSDGNSLHFDGQFERQLITVDMDLTSATFVEYNIQLGDQVADSSNPNCRDPTTSEGVVLAFSTDNGVSWTKFDAVTSARAKVFRSVSLPTDARVPGVKLMWWQPVHEESVAGYDEWLLDDIFIGYGSLEVVTALSDDMSGSRGSDWLFFSTATTANCGNETSVRIDTGGMSAPGHIAAWELASNPLSCTIA